MTKILTIVFIAVLFSVSCGKKPDSHKPFLRNAPPGETGMNPEILAELISDIKTEKIKNVHGLLVIKDDKLIVEEYFGGYRRNDLHYSASITKSFASVLLGIAIDKGYFKGSVQTVLNRDVKVLFPEYADIIEKDSLKSGLKLKHILSMTAGFDWDEHTFPYTDRRNDCNKINRSRDPMRFLFERKLVRRPGEEFYYNGGLSLSVSYLIEKYTGMSALEFAERNLFEPLEIEEYRWDEVANGLIDTDGGLHLKPVDQSKLGYLFLQKGRWRGRQLVSEEWVTESTKMRVDNTDQPDYGYQWWGGDFYCQDTTWYTFFASGHGGQKVIVFPDYNLIVVISQQVFNNPLGHLNFIAILNNYIVPSLSGKLNRDEAIPLPAADLSKYCGRYFSQNRSEFVDVESGGGALILTGSNGDKNEFYSVGEHTFKARILNLIDIRVKFGIDENGKVATLQSKFGYKNLRFGKNAEGDKTDAQ
ncbi:MAG: serine hydrolase [Calditrichaeota bacterium]|nr:serine hydrolase [Calditrichota bacterium]